MEGRKENRKERRKEGRERPKVGKFTLDYNNNQVYDSIKKYILVNGKQQSVQRCHNNLMRKEYYFQ